MEGGCREGERYTLKRERERELKGERERADQGEIGGTEGYQ